MKSDYTADTPIEELVSDILSNEQLEAGMNPLTLVEDAMTRKYPSLYCLRFKPIRSKPLTFKSSTSALRNRPWQQGILDDTHPNKVIEKSRQLGLSELAVSEVIWFLDVHPNTTAVYTFPRAQQMTDFSNTRVLPVLQESPYLASLAQGSPQNVATKKIGESYLFMRSAWGGAMGEGVAADYLGMDEFDRQSEGVEFAFQEGLRSSKYGLLRRWSTPTLPGYGINELFNKSDQMRYFHKCPHCGYKQFLQADENILQIKPHGVNNATQEIEDGTFIIGCSKCKKELDRWQEGEWVPLYPSIKETRGYHISQMDATWIDADSIMRRRFTYTSNQLFYNYVIGEPYANEGLVIQEEDIKANIRVAHEVRGPHPDYVAFVAGIDWGEPSHMIILGIRAGGSVDLIAAYLAYSQLGKPLSDATEFAVILKTYSPNAIICDFGYGADKNSYMYAAFPTQFYSCYWTTARTPLSNVQFIDRWNEKSRQVTVDKTVKTQRMLHAIKNGLMGFFPWNETLSVIYSHFHNTRILDQESEGIVYQTAVRVGPDHYATATNYALIGVDRLLNYGLALSGNFSAEFI